MANYLKMLKKQQVLSLLELGWTFRRIEAETGVRRETVSRYAKQWRSKAAKVFPGSEPDAASAEVGAVDPAASKAAKVFPGSELPSRASAAGYHDAIVEKLELGLSIQRVWQDLVEELGYGHSYESVKRYVRTLRRKRRVVGVIHAAPGEEGQVDFVRGVATFDASSGEWRRPWIFRLTLACSRHGYEEAVWDQKLETFLRLHENAFTELGGVPKVIRHDNLKAGVVRACLYDPDAHEVYTAFAQHWGFTALPTRPRNPRENGKQERAGGYVKDNALRGRRFQGLEECNAHLRKWNRTVARLRIHGTTRRQVWSHYLEVEKPALGPLAAEPFVLFESGERLVHPDGHIEVAGAFYPMPASLLGQSVRVRWDRHLVRAFRGDQLMAVHRRVAAGQFAPRPGQHPDELLSSQQAFLDRLLARCEQIGADLRCWAEAAYRERGVRALRLLQGVLGLARRHRREHLLHAARTALEHRLFRYKDLQRLTALAEGKTRSPRLINEHPLIRPMTDYRLEDFL